MEPPRGRRGFLKGIAGSVAALPVVPALMRAASGSELVQARERLVAGNLADESYWRNVKGQFAIKPDFIMLNAANLCPSPHLVKEALYRLTDDLDGDVSFQNRAKFETLREEARNKLASLMGASADEIAIVRNTRKSLAA